MWNKYLKSSAILKKGFQHYHNDNMLMQINFNTIGFFWQPFKLQSKINWTNYRTLSLK